MTRAKSWLTYDEDGDGVINMDADLENADWTKQSWDVDIPPYKSPEFMQLYPDLSAFRKTPLYNHAVAAGLIVDDEWGQ